MAEDSDGLYDNNKDYTQDILASFRETYKQIHHNQREEANRNMRLNRKLNISYKPGDVVNIWRHRNPGKLERRYAGPYVIHAKRNDNSYIINIGTWSSTTSEHIKGTMKTKQVSVRHIRSYSPFNDYISDTSHKFVEEQENDSDEDDLEWDRDDHTTIQADTFCIIPYWGWQTLQYEGQLWTVAKILRIYSSQDTGEKQDSVLVRRYGSDTGQYEDKQKPG
jgi:hypothetical protein